MSCFPNEFHRTVSQLFSRRNSISHSVSCFQRKIQPQSQSDVFKKRNFITQSVSCFWKGISLYNQSVIFDKEFHLSVNQLLSKINPIAQYLLKTADWLCNRILFLKQLSVCVMEFLLKNKWLTVWWNPYRKQLTDWVIEFHFKNNWLTVKWNLFRKTTGWQFDRIHFGKQLTDWEMELLIKNNWLTVQWNSFLKNNWLTVWWNCFLKTTDWLCGGNPFRKQLSKYVMEFV